MVVFILDLLCAANWVGSSLFWPIWIVVLLALVVLARQKLICRSGQGCWVPDCGFTLA